jgi:signal peptidase I
VATHSPSVKRKSALREWANALIYTFLIATVVHWLLVEAFWVPSSSMEGALLPGDYVLVSKLAYGAQTPRTPLQVPLVGSTLPGTARRSYWAGWQWPAYRLPGLGQVQRGDVVVFYYPADDEAPVDMRPPYLKRCAALPGDTLEIANQRVLVNGRLSGQPATVQHSYALKVRPGAALNLAAYGISGYLELPGTGYMVHCPAAVAQRLAQDPAVAQLAPNEYAPGMDSEKYFPFSRFHAWNPDNYGPVWVPKKGATLPLNEQTLAIYQTTIEQHERPAGWQVKAQPNGGLPVAYLHGQPVAQYTFKQDYYFMLGDNRHNSEDSRTWGFVPADHVVGKAWLTWFSLAPEGEGFWSRIRWARMFKSSY